MKEVDYECWLTNFGFRWGNVLVERAASNSKKPKFQIIQVYAPNGEGVTVIMTPRKLRVEKFKREKK